MGDNSIENTGVFVESIQHFLLVLLPHLGRQFSVALLVAVFLPGGHGVANVSVRVVGNPANAIPLQVTLLVVFVHHVVGSPVRGDLVPSYLQALLNHVPLPLLVDTIGRAGRSGGDDGSARLDTVRPFSLFNLGWRWDHPSSVSLVHTPVY